jgi:hypothetical protein
LQQRRIPDWTDGTAGTLRVDGVLAADMQPLTASGSPQPRLAAAFLALSDVDPAPGADVGTSPLAVLATLAATVVLALSAPLAWLSGPVPRPADQPVATQASKAAEIPGLDDDGAGSGAG